MAGASNSSDFECMEMVAWWGSIYSQNLINADAVALVIAVVSPGYG
jgi:hypothetical protein